MTAHPIRAGLILGATAWAVLIAAIIIDELKLARRQRKLSIADTPSAVLLRGQH